MFRVDEEDESPSAHGFRAYQRIEFPTLQHFVEDVVRAKIGGLRLDLFEDAKQSELSFVYYVTLTVYLTAQDPTGYILYEYAEPIGTTANTHPHLHDEKLHHLARQRLQEIEAQLSEMGLTVRRGRYTIPVS